jgi:hypothetical protein
VAIIWGMSDDNSEKPDPIEDVRKGLGLLFRAAKSTLEQLPTQKLEEAVVTGAREVGRAIENVTEAIDQQLFKRPAGTSEGSSGGDTSHASPGEAPRDAHGEAKSDGPTGSADKGDGADETDPPRGPRVG